MNAVAPLPSNGDLVATLRTRLPAELIRLRQFVLWKIEPAKNGEPTKVPYSPQTGAKASSTNDATWGAFDQAARRYRQGGYAGLGIVLRNLAGVDLDDCRDPESGELADWARQEIERLSSYTEVSPSKTGVHILARTTHARCGHKRGNVELYIGDGRFFTLTGAHIEGTPTTLEERTDELTQLRERHFAKPAASEPSRTRPPVREPLSLSDADLLAKAMRAADGAKFSALWRGNTSSYASESEADSALCTLLRFWWQADPTAMDRMFRQSGLVREKWDRPESTFGTYGARTINQVLVRFEGSPVYDPGAYKGNRSRSQDQQPTGADGVQERKVYARTEMGNTERLSAAYGPNIRYSKSFGYCTWDGKRWRPDGELQVAKWAKLVIRGIYADAAQLAQHANDTEDETERGLLAARAKELMAWAIKSETDRMVKAMLSLLRDECEIEVEAFDKRPWLFNCANGTIDLQSGELRPHRRDDYLMQCSPVEYDPKASAPTFLRFLDEIMCGDVEMARYLQRVFGYCLSGSVEEQEWYLAVGEGDNGKSTLIEAVSHVYGDFAHAMEPESVTMTRQVRDAAAPSPDIADLKGKRFVKITETEENARLAPARVKKLSGGDELTGRRLRRDPFAFRPTHKLFIHTNHLPEARETTHAFWRRVRYIPFAFSLKDHPERKDRELPTKLQAEAAGILAWMVQGCLEWRRSGMRPPERVLRAGKDYRKDMDILQAFIDERCVIGPTLQVKASRLYKAYSEWCKDTNEYAQTQRRFGSAIRERGFTDKRNNGIWYVGIGLVEPDPNGDLWSSAGDEQEEPTERTTEQRNDAEPLSDMTPYSDSREGVFLEKGSVRFRSSVEGPQSSVAIHPPPSPTRGRPCAVCDAWLVRTDTGYAPCPNEPHGGKGGAR